MNNRRERELAEEIEFHKTMRGAEVPGAIRHERERRSGESQAEFWRV